MQAYPSPTLSNNNIQSKWHWPVLLQLLHQNIILNQMGANKKKVYVSLRHYVCHIIATC